MKGRHSDFVLCFLFFIFSYHGANKKRIAKTLQTAMGKLRRIYPELWFILKESCKPDVRSV